MDKCGLAYTAVVSLICLGLAENTAAQPTYSLADRIADSIILESVSSGGSGGWLSDLLSVRPSAGAGAGERSTHHTKRNSEIINSLLGIPKVINDAGR